jgi:GGDEF domain-containing protein
MTYAGDEIRVGASIGIAVSPDDGRSATILLAAADRRMYQRKRGRRRTELGMAA